MKKLKVSTDFSFARSLYGKKGFLSLKDKFSLIAISEYEPDCPFCKRRLIDAECKCSKFKASLNAITQKMKNKSDKDKKVHVSSRYPGSEGCNHFIKIRDNLEIIEQEENTFKSDIFACGTSLKDFDISPGDYENNQLIFFINEKSTRKTYKCIVYDFFYTKEEKSIYFYTIRHVDVSLPRSFPFSSRVPECESETPTLNTIYNQLKEVSYTEYLKMLVSAPR